MVMLFAIIFGIVTGAVADKYNRNVVGWAVFGFMLFIVAMPVLLISGPLNTKTCPHCRESIKEEATMCRHCRSQV